MDNWVTKPQSSPSPVLSKLDEILKTTNETVPIVPIVTSVNTVYTSGYDVKEWKKIINSQLIGTCEQDILKHLGHHKNLKIIDRSTIETVFGELHFSMAISSETRLKLDKFLGVKYIIAIEYNRAQEGRRALDTSSSRLIDIETGVVLASEMHRYYPK